MIKTAKEMKSNLKRKIVMGHWWVETPWKIQQFVLKGNREKHICSFNEILSISH